MTMTINQRGLVASIGMAICFTGFSFRLVHLQVTQHKYYETKAARQNIHTEPIYARRGAILDVNNVPLAQNEPVKTVVADGSLIKDFDKIAALIAGPLEMPVEVVRAKLSKKAKPKSPTEQVAHRYIVLRKGLSEEKAGEITKLVAAAKKEGLVYAVEAIRYEQDFIRVYPNASTLSHVLGYVNEAGVGMSGIEASMNNRLQCTNGERNLERDRTGREIVLYRGQDKKPEDGGNVRLTVDLNLQQIVAVLARAPAAKSACQPR